MMNAAPDVYKDDSVDEVECVEDVRQRRSVNLQQTTIRIHTP